MAITAKQARIELARRELERREQPPANTPKQFSGVGGLPGIGDSLTAGFDLAKTAGRDLLGTGAATLGALLRPESAIGGPQDAGIFERIKQNAMFNRPLQTDQGIDVAERIGPPLERLSLGVSDAFERVPGGPVAQAAAKTAVLGPLELLGLRGAGSVARAASSTGIAAPGTFIPQVKDLFAAGRVAFNEARLRGGGVKPEALSRAANNIRNIKNEIGLRIDFDPDIHGPAHSVRNRLLNELDSGDIDFDNLLTLRELASDVAGNKDKAISMRGMRMRNAIDDFVNDLGPDDVLSGDPQRSAEALANARKFWRDASTARTIEREINLAGIDADDFTGAGFENKLRIRFRQLARRIEKGQERGFTPEEISAIQRVAKGGPVDNIFRFIGKAAPTGVVSAGLGGILGYAVGGPAGAAAIPAIGAAGRHLATRATIKNAQNALEKPLRSSLLGP